MGHSFARRVFFCFTALLLPSLDNILDIVGIRIELELIFLVLESLATLFFFPVFFLSFTREGMLVSHIICKPKKPIDLCTIEPFPLFLHAAADSQDCQRNCCSFELKNAVSNYPVFHPCKTQSSQLTICGCVGMVRRKSFFYFLTRKKKTQTVILFVVLTILLTLTDLIIIIQILVAVGIYIIKLFSLYDRIKYIDH